MSEPPRCSCVTGPRPAGPLASDDLTRVPLAGGRSRDLGDPGGDKLSTARSRTCCCATRSRQKRSEAPVPLRGSDLLWDAVPEAFKRPELSTDGPEGKEPAGGMGSWAIPLLPSGRLDSSSDDPIGFNRGIWANAGTGSALWTGRGPSDPERLVFPGSEVTSRCSGR